MLFIYGELPKPTKTGYNFKGWFDDKGKEISSTNVVKTPYDNILTAVWKEMTASSSTSKKDKKDTLIFIIGITVSLVFIIMVALVVTVFILFKKNR